MSLVNDMLKDLNERNSGEGDTPESESFDGLRAPIHVEERRRPFVPVVAMLGLAGVFLFAWVSRNTAEIEAPGELAGVPAEAVGDAPNLDVASGLTPDGDPSLVAAAAVSSDGSHAQAVYPKAGLEEEPQSVLQYIEVWREDGVTRLRFATDGAPDYDFQLDPETHVLRLSFENTRYATRFPGVDFRNTRIESMTPVPTEDGSLAIDFQLTENSEIDMDTVTGQDGDSIVLLLSGEGQALAAAAPQDDTAVDLSGADAVPSEFEDVPVVAVRPRPPTKRRLADTAYREGLELAEDGDLASAMDKFAEALSHLPLHANARRTLAVALARQGRLEEANLTLAEGLRQDRSQSGLAKLQARVLVERGAPAEALSVLEASAPMVSEDPEYHAFIAALRELQGQHAEAARIYGKVLKLEPLRSNWWIGLGISLEADGQSARALPVYETARRIGGLDPDSRNYIETRIAVLSQPQ